MSDLAAQLRAIRVFDGKLPLFDPEDVPDEPVALFTEWLLAGVPEPDAVVLSTVDGAGAQGGRAEALVGRQSQHVLRYQSHGRSWSHSLLRP